MGSNTGLGALIAVDTGLNGPEDIHLDRNGDGIALVELLEEERESMRCEAVMRSEAFPHCRFEVLRCDSGRRGRASQRDGEIR